MPVRLLIPGRPEASLAASARGGPGASQRSAQTDLLQGVEVVGAYSLSPSARAYAAAEPQTIDVAEDDVLEFELDGITCWTSVARYQREQALYRPEAVTGAGVVVDGISRPSAAERGVRDWAAGALRILRLGTDSVATDAQDPALRESFMRELGLDAGTRLAGWLLTRFLAWLIERRLRPGEGLYSWQAATQAVTAAQEDPAPATLDGLDPRTPLLIFLHGTASSTRGSFGAFQHADSAPEWRALTTLFGRHIYGFEHRTMSRSPIENALTLARALPAQARVSLISHSRGGLIGDLLCLPGLTSAQIDSFVRAGAGAGEADAVDRLRLHELAEVLAAKQLRIERFLRCASPSRGTLLASENLDEFLSILTNLVGLVPALAASPVYDVITRITLEAARQRWQPSALPGVEAMTPGSPLVRLLNASTDVAHGRLGIVAGDIEGGHLFKRIGVFITDRFIYDHRDNDLVVNTDAMFHGARRDSAWYVYDQGADVSHFTYFANARTRAAAAQWVTAPGETVPSEFREREVAEVAPVPMVRALSAVSTAARPVAVVVPGFMGSELHVDATRVWPAVEALSAGRLATLADVTAADVTAPALVGDVYRRLCERLAGSHDVVPFAYDWRQSLVHSAAAFDVLITGLLAHGDTAIRVIAHGMGGCVARLWMSRHPKTWERLAARDGARMVWMGVPLRGSFDAVQALVGTHPVLQQLALLDPVLGRSGCVELVQKWPGLLELLPRDADNSFAQTATWRDLRREVPAPAPRAAALKAAAAVLKDASTAPPFADRVVALAGTSPRTVCKVLVRDDTTLLEMTSEGDGRVTYASAHVPGIVTWFTDVPHGDVPGDQGAWSALQDLLERGTTRRLGTVPPSAARGGRTSHVTRPEPVLYPTPDALELAALGHRPRIVRRRAERGGFRVGVVYGDLRFARHPVLVGHYEGDTIVGAEGEIDRVLDGALRTRYNLGLYPGPYGSVGVVLRRPTELQQSLRLMSGAVVLGLGRWGELTAAQVANLVRRGTLQYVLQRDEQRVEGEPMRDGAEQLGLSVLLIGSTSTANISIDDSVGAILRGIAQANQELLSRLGHLHAMVGEVEIIELYADTAIQAARAATRLAATISEELGTNIVAAPILQRGRHGRVRLTAANTADAWRRWEITARTQPGPSPSDLPAVIREQVRRAVVGQPAEPALVEALADLALGRADQAPVTQVRFVSLSERARAEVMLQHRQPELIERLVQASIGQTAYRAQDARALFELMVPNDLKDGMGQLSRLVFVVDEETARYPWELMSDGGPPLCTRLGMVRQLQTSRYRPQIRASTARTAFVVGDPLVTTPFPQLPGARVEATVVADLLASGPQPFTITRRVDRPTALDVLGGLFEQPYRVVHIAGHGYYEAPSASGHGRSGVVLDGGVYLTAVEFGQMLQVPELVFLNCCFIGQTGPEQTSRGRDVPYNKLAASVARELIEMGVRAVVAAGWAVRDDAALHFARLFYTQMLRGATFGRALQEARASTFHQFPESNTWGAYQAYGDPDFRMDEGTEAKASQGRVAHEELIDLLERLREHARIPGRDGEPSAAAEAIAQQLTQLDRLVEETPSAWLGRSDVLMAIGHTYGEWSALDRAIIYITKALDTGELDNRTTLKAVEQLANFEARLAMGEANRSDARDRIGVSISRLWGLQAVAETAERYGLIGSAYKQLAKVCDSRSDVRTALEQAGDSYRRAHVHNTGLHRSDPYPIVNWIGIQALLGDLPADAADVLAIAEASARERFETARDPFDAVFDAVAVPDIALVAALIDGTLAKAGAARDQAVARLVALYHDAFRRTYATPRQMASATGQLRFLSQIMARLATPKTADRLRQTGLALDDIHRRIGGAADDGPPADATPAPADPEPAPATARKRSSKSRKSRKPAKPRMS